MIYRGLEQFSQLPFNPLETKIFVGLETIPNFELQLFGSGLSGIGRHKPIVFLLSHKFIPSANLDETRAHELSSASTPAITECEIVWAVGSHSNLFIGIVVAESKLCLKSSPRCF